MYMSSRQVFDPAKESLYSICGDAPDPSGMDPRMRGYQSSIDMTKGALAKPLIRWRDRVIEGDLYEIEGKLVLHLICPKCSSPACNPPCNIPGHCGPHALYVRQERKAIEWDAERQLLSVESFECTWELPEGRRQEFGLGLCRWRVAIENNIARDMR